MDTTRFLTPQAARQQKGLGELDSLVQCGWDLLGEEVALPVALLSRSALQNNLRWMRDFSLASDVSLAPHGKTSMSPELFRMQLEAGCWGLSLATAQQLVAASQSGVSRVMLANQLVGKRNMQLVADQIREGLECYCFVDCLDNLKTLDGFFTHQGLSMNVLVEIGVPGGRCGVRRADQANTLCRAIGQFPSLKLRGLAFYEGVIHGDPAEQQIAGFVEQNRQLLLELLEQDYFAPGEVLISGAGSAWYDLVVRHLDPATLPGRIRVLLRPGCYLIHDTGIYAEAQQQVRQRSTLACDIQGDLISSLTLWAYVQSVPEPGMAVIGMGKRDVAFDAGLPAPVLHHRPGRAAPVPAQPGWRLVRIMDQHAMLEYGADADLQVGDMLSFSTSHPCLTMDKWRYLGIVDDDFRIRQLIQTCF